MSRIYIEIQWLMSVTLSYTKIYPQAQYGMEEDDDEGYTHRATNSLKRAVYSGALSVAGYYERSLGLRRAAASGTDTGSSRTTGEWGLHSTKLDFYK